MPPGLSDLYIALESKIQACVGTLDYLAPEMLLNPSNDLEEGYIPEEQLEELAIKPYGPSIDVWAVGIIAYELVAGSAPFSLCGDEQQTMRRILDWHDIAFPNALSSQWADFVRCAAPTAVHTCNEGI